MKKIFSVIAIAAMAMLAFSCKEKENPINDLDNIVEDGVYVMIGGKIDANYAMAKGINEAASQAVREGMYEKYIVLDKDQEFTLAYKAGDKTVKYGAQLAEFTPAELSGIYDSNPATPVLKGALVEGDNAPAMKAAKKALYHIVLDLNLDKKLDNAQILVAEAQYGVRGGMNSWGFTALEATEASNDGITYTLSGQQLGSNGEFKFAYNSAWKITLDAAGEVKANTNLGKDCKPGGDNIVVTDGAGAYKIELKFKLAAGDVANSWQYTVTQESKADYPANIYMIGAAWGAWSWDSEGVVELQHISAGGDAKDGCFVVTRYFKADDGFKFATAKDWGKAFNKMGNDPATVTYDGDGNIHVPADGLYTITLDYTSDTMTLTEGKLFGIGDAFGGWNAVEGTVNADGTASITTTAAGNIRTYAPCAFDWWQHEFQPTSDGKIAYREGGELEGFAVEAGVTVTYDFNAGTATVGGGAAAGIKLDGNFDDWKDIEAIAGRSGGTMKEWKYASDAENIYLYTKIDKNDIIAAKAEDPAGSGKFPFNWRRYFYIGIDTDNNAETPTADAAGKGDLEITGCEVVALIYPFRGNATSASGTDGSEVVNGVDEQGWVKLNGAEQAGKMAAWGVIDDEFGYLEMSLPKASVGGATGTMKIQFSLSYNLSDIGTMVIE
ncbi:MAG: SusF/SusE family outer membrane protein [Bacteroidales bacterium]|nr:SusF/SusE family outer membrane protein [Bacteroidales bacterium]